MYYHLKKIAVGIETVDRLRIRQSMIHETYGKIIHSTRNMPKKSSELIKSGSIFWIIKRYVLVRQKITDIKQVVREDGSKGCEIELDKNLINNLSKHSIRHEIEADEFMINKIQEFNHCRF